MKREKIPAGASGWNHGPDCPCPVCRIRGRTQRELYSRGLPITVTRIPLFEAMSVTGGDNDEEVHILSIDEFQKKIQDASGMSNKEFIANMLYVPGGREQILEVAKKVWGPKTNAFRTTAGKHKIVEQFYQSQLNKKVKIGDFSSINACEGEIIEEKIYKDRDTDCGNTQYLVRYTKDCEIHGRKHKKGERGEANIHSLLVKENDDWIRIDDKKFLICEIPGDEQGRCHTDKSICCPQK
jgi:hypothetical protein